MKYAILVSPYFLPSNLAGVQRVRLMSRALKDYGWIPIVVTVDSEHYEEPLDLESLRLLRRDLVIERVSAWPARLCRMLGIGDVSLRGQVALRRKVADLVRRLRPSLVFTTVLPGYTSLVGSRTKKQFNLPFVLDYQDPWVPPVAEAQRRWNKAGLAYRLARWLEPKVLSRVDALTAVSQNTLDTLRSRNLIRSETLIEIIPIGVDREDHMVAKLYGRSLIRRRPGVFQIAYLGTLTQRMLPALEIFLQALNVVNLTKSVSLVVHLIGTSAQPRGEDQHNLPEIVKRFGLEDLVHVHPSRIGYLDALRTMQEADLLILLGSTDPHYTASKLFPYWLSGKPVLGVFHAASTVVELSGELGGVSLVLYTDAVASSSRVMETVDVLKKVIRGEAIAPARNDLAFAPYSAEGIGARYAKLFDRVCDKCT